MIYAEKYIYFMRPVGAEGPVKIGCSIKPRSRLSQYLSWSPFMLEIVATAPGTHRLERSLHKIFDRDRLHGEWFAASRELLEMIAYVVEHGAVPPVPLVSNDPRYPEPVRKMTANHKAKVLLSCRIGHAERHAFGSAYTADKERRPARITAIMESYSGAGVPVPVGEELAEIEDYIAALWDRPKHGKPPRHAVWNGATA